MARYEMDLNKKKILLLLESEAIYMTLIKKNINENWNRLKLSGQLSSSV